MNAASLNDNLRKALDDYYDLDELSHSPLQSLHALWDSDNIVQGVSDLNWEGYALQALLDRALEELGKDLPEQQALLDQKFRKKLTINELQEQFHLRSARIHERIGEAVVALAAVIVKLENLARLKQSQHRQRLLGPLPVIEGRPLGIDAAVTDLRARLRQQLVSLGNPILVTGLGGIGKTTIALEALRTWVTSDTPPIERILWVSVNSSSLIRDDSVVLGNLLFDLAAQLDLFLDPLHAPEKHVDTVARHLSSRMRKFALVIDNIETDTEHRAALRLANAVRGYIPLVLTSRQAFDLGRGILQVLPAYELPQDVAFLLIAQEATRLDLPPLPESEMQEIYEMVGGHPYALKLVVAQNRFLPLAEIFNMLGTRGEVTDEFFDDIYEVTWSFLSETAEAVVIGLTLLPPTGGYWETVVANVDTIYPDLPTPELNKAIQLLTELNLLQVRYTSKRQRVYALHRLTYQYVERRAGLE